MMNLLRTFWFIPPKKTEQKRIDELSCAKAALDHLIEARLTGKISAAQLEAQRNKLPSLVKALKNRTH